MFIRWGTGRNLLRKMVLFQFFTSWSRIPVFIVWRNLILYFMSNWYFFKWDIYGLFFFTLVFSIQLTVIKMFNINFVDDWIWTADLWLHKRPLYQLSHNHWYYSVLRLAIPSKLIFFSLEWSHTDKKVIYFKNYLLMLMAPEVPWCA